MRHSLFIVIAIAIATLGTEAAPETRDGIAFRVTNGTTLCSLEQCQCEKLSGGMTKILCDCKSQVKEFLTHEI